MPSMRVPSAVDSTHTQRTARGPMKYLTSAAPDVSHAPTIRVVSRVARPFFERRRIGDEMTTRFEVTTLSDVTAVSPST